MAQHIAAEEGAPPAIAALSIAGDAGSTSKVTEQVIDPWSVQAATDADGNDLAFDYEAISKSVSIRTSAVQEN
jgi:tryptophanyl-tRNA synthetase